jgi:hypothetical protein
VPRTIPIPIYICFFIIGQIQLRRGENRFLLIFDISSFAQRGVDLKGIEHKMSIICMFFCDDNPEGRQRLMVLEIGASNHF